MTDEDGEVAQTLDYYPYGSQRIAPGPSPNSADSSGRRMTSTPNSRTSTPATTKAPVGSSFRRILSSLHSAILEE